MKNNDKLEQTNQNESLNITISNSYSGVRQFSEELTKPLETEDYVIQSMPDVSPTKWHLAHTSWFFETFVLSEINRNYRSPHPQFNFLFNSYYVQVGERHCRPKRGLISRPTVEEVVKYRRHVDQNMLEFLEIANEEQLSSIASVIELGLHHEQQHQELMLTDIKHVFSENPLRPAYTAKEQKPLDRLLPEIDWIEYPEGVYEIGHNGGGFSFDNERPVHKEYANPFKLANRLVTNLEYLEFIEDGGYKRPEIWLSDGWNTVEANNWNAPLYWEEKNGNWQYFSLSGTREIALDEPVCHVSYYEADAFSRWAGDRLPTEAEWEIAASNLSIEGNFVEKENYHPMVISAETNNRKPQQMFGDVWEWTRSPYGPYPGYSTIPGAIGEYNGKFMCNQMVLRGGSCATSRSHIRKTYRNFFPPDARWQFMGIRLAKDAKQPS
jgi:ergothioneine biosynthesis protein EgtB